MPFSVNGYDHDECPDSEHGYELFPHVCASGNALHRAEFPYYVRAYDAHHAHVSAHARRWNAHARAHDARLHAERHRLPLIKQLAKKPVSKILLER